jgi:tetratricopeptide (TPR) repeat protein
MDLSRPEAAIKALDLARNCNPDFHNTYLLLGHAYRKLDRFDDAKKAFNTLLTGDPDHIDALMGMGYTHHEQLNLDKALGYYDTVLELDSDNVDAHWNKATLLLIQGDFKRGWVEAEWRKKLPGYPAFSHKQPQWDGSDLNGKRILLESEQGYGDSIQFIRYAEQLKDMGAYVIVSTSKALFSLFKNIKAIDSLVLSGEKKPGFDVFAPLMSLPFLLYDRSSVIPDKIPYIELEQKESIVSRELKNDVLKIGISWAGNALNKNDRKRSCSLHHFTPLFALKGFQFYSFQMGNQKQELNSLNDHERIIDLSPHISDFLDTASLMKHMDLIISVDSAPAHLAGAIGKPIWLTIPCFPDWRWLLERDDCPWYPTMRIFRQPSPGDWQHVIHSIQQELIKLADSKVKPLNPDQNHAHFTRRSLSGGGTLHIK